MPLWQAVVMEKWLLVEDPLESDNLMTSVTTSFVKDYARDCLWRHVRNCPQKSVEVETRVGQKQIHTDLPKADTVHEAVWKIACEMNQDDISLVVT